MKQSGDKITPLFLVEARGEDLLEIANDKKQQRYVVLIDSPGA